MRLKDTGLTSQDIKDKVNKYMIETYERFDFLAERAKDMYMYDENGEAYLDFYAGIAVNNAGSCNEKVVAAVKDQVGDIMHTFNYPYTIPQALLAEKVCETIGMDKIFYQNSGTEANEAMIKMARKYGIEKYGPNHYHIVTAKMGFHGRTFGAMSATGQPGNGCQVGFGPMTYGFSYAPYNNLQAFKDACTENTIAIMIEPVQGEGGVHPATQEFMQGLREFCDENDMLLLIDEVQTGWCRTGAVMSYMNYGIKPDIVSMAKGLGGGMPIGAICATEEVAKAFTPGSHGTTSHSHRKQCGPDIGRMVAESLGIPFYDRDLVDQVVEKLGVDRDLVEKADSGQENVKYEFDTTFGPRYANLTNRVIYTQFEVIHKLAAKSSCVIIGRCSNYILKDRDDCLNIFVYASEEYKVKHIMEQKGVSQKEAQKLVKYNDGMLKSRYEYMTNSDLRDCRTRHMMIDSSILGLEKTAKYIMQLIDLRFED